MQFWCRNCPFFTGCRQIPMKSFNPCGCRKLRGARWAVAAPRGSLRTQKVISKLTQCVDFRTPRNKERRTKERGACWNENAALQGPCWHPLILLIVCWDRRAVCGGGKELEKK